MKRLYTAALLLALALGAAAPAAPASDTPAAHGSVGSVVNDFTLPDAGGRQHSLAQLRGKHGTVIIFVSTQCPVSNAYNERMEKLAQELGGRGVRVVGVNSNATESAADVKRHAADRGLTFTILKDAGNRVADQLGAQVTPEVYFLDASGKIVYRGRIDNSRNGDNITSQELREAVEATLAGRPVAKPEVRAFGCSIKRA